MLRAPYRYFVSSIRSVTHLKFANNVQWSPASIPLLLALNPRHLDIGRQFLHPSVTLMLKDARRYPENEDLHRMAQRGHEESESQVASTPAAPNSPNRLCVQCNHLPGPAHPSGMLLYCSHTERRFTGKSYSQQTGLGPNSQYMMWLRALKSVTTAVITTSSMSNGAREDDLKVDLPRP